MFVHSEMQQMAIAAAADCRCSRGIRRLYRTAAQGPLAKGPVADAAAAAERELYFELLLLLGVVA